jgi:hypothetical protein
MLDANAERGWRKRDSAEIPQSAFHLLLSAFCLPHSAFRLLITEE